MLVSVDVIIAVLGYFQKPYKVNEMEAFKAKQKNHQFFFLTPYLITIPCE